MAGKWRQWRKLTRHSSFLQRRNSARHWQSRSSSVSGFKASPPYATRLTPSPTVHTTLGPLRLPPNDFPALLFASSPSTIPMTPSPPPTVRHDVPNIPGAFLLADLLTLAECRAIIGHAESVGFAPDRPVGDQASVLAHNLYWLADRPFLETMYERFLHLVPQVISGGKATGLNARFRVYRYVSAASAIESHGDAGD